VVLALQLRHLPNRALKTRLGDSGRLDSGHLRRFFRAKGPHFDADGGDACECRNPPRGTIVDTFRARTLGENPKLSVSSTSACGVLSLSGAFAWSSFPLGFVVPFFLIFISDLLC
jgi:hypothetical protein